MAPRRVARPRERRGLTVAAAALVLALGLAALHRLLGEVHLRDVRAALAGLPDGRLAAAAALTALSYALLILYDRAGLSAIGRSPPWRTTALASFLGHAVAYNLGLSLLTGASARHRIYRASGVSLAEAARVGAVGSVAFWSGVALAAGAALLARPGPERWLGPLLAAGALLPTALRAAGVTRLGRGAVSLPLPTPAWSAALLLVSVADLAAASGALFVLAPGLGQGGFPAFFLAYALGIVVALLAHVPGGLGVFEAVMLAALPADRPGLFAALILYRLIYYVAPLMIAPAVVAVREAAALRRGLATGLRVADRVGQALAPPAVTLLVFIGGIVLLVSGALPGVEHRLDDLDGLLPLPLIEVSHLAGSLIGTALLLVAPALNARLRSGFLAARPLLLGGALFSLAKGLDWEEALVELAVLAVLQYARPSFYRRGGLPADALDRRWLGAAAAALALSLWAGFFAYKRVPYSDDLWWRFALDGNAPRFLRASFAAGVLLAGAAGWRMLGGRRRREAPAPLPAAVAARSLAAAARTDALLAFTGDKRFVVAADGDAFLMYRVWGRTWIVMGDPVGPPGAWSGLAWRLREIADRAHGRLCFYQASAAMLPLLVELGLGVMKVGEEAHVPLAGFTLAGSRARGLRHALRHGDALGLDFAIVPADGVPALLDELRVVSDAWLANKPGGEKRFSLGAFDPAYVARFPCAVVRRAHRVIAFATIWPGAAGGELSVDLMRHLPDAPPGTMDLLFARLFHWGAAEGFGWFNLGVAPLSGLPGGRLAPLWARIGRVLFERGERFYGFVGLRAFKAKFRPDWEPRYVATPGGLDRVRALVALLRVINA